MSYIRCTSNPEGLYVIQEARDIVFWWRPSGSKEAEICTYEARYNGKAFKSFMKKMKKSDGFIYHKGIKYKDISIREVTALYKKRDRYQNKIVNILEEDEFPDDYNEIYDKYTTKHLVCLQIKDKQILMYDVTWKYFYNSYIEQNDL